MYLLCEHERGIVMETKSKYFVVKQKAVPEVLLKVVEAKKLLESERVITVQEATEAVGISRSSFCWMSTQRRWTQRLRTRSFN